MVMVISREEFINKYGEEQAEPFEDEQAVETFVVSSDDECPIIGIIYINGEKWIYGAKFDRKVESVDEMIEWLEDIK